MDTQVARRSQSWAKFLERWHARFGTALVRPDKIQEFMGGTESALFAGRTRRGRQSKVGLMLARNIGVIYGGFVLEQIPDRNGNRYRVLPDGVTSDPDELLYLDSATAR